VNVLDENVVDSQRRLLERWRIAVRQIGVELGTMGMTDQNIIPLLHELHGPTFFTRDVDFYRPHLRHEKYCLDRLDARVSEVAEYVRRFLRHPDFNTQAKRMVAVVSVAPAEISIWRIQVEQVTHSMWPVKKRK
jgi:hypothetical protein